MSSTVGPKIAVVDSITDGSTYGDIGRAFLRMYQALIQPNVINLSTSTPPSTPNNGDTYVVAAGATGAWVGKQNMIAYWTTDDPNVPAGKWEFYLPLTGWTVVSQANNGQYEYNGTNWVGARTASFNFEVDGGGSAITTGAKGQWNVPVACTVTGWVLTADQSGSCVVDVLRSTYAGFPSTSSIAGSDKPTLSSVQKNENLGPLSGWGSTALSAGDQIQINVNSATTVTRINLTLNVTVP